jgi:hypothetical protein
MYPPKLREPFSELFDQSRFVVDWTCELNVEVPHGRTLRRYSAIYADKGKL